MYIVGSDLTPADGWNDDLERLIFFLSLSHFYAFVTATYLKPGIQYINVVWGGDWVFFFKNILVYISPVFL